MEWYEHEQTANLPLDILNTMGLINYTGKFPEPALRVRRHGYSHCGAVDNRWSTR